MAKMAVKMMETDFWGNLECKRGWASLVTALLALTAAHVSSITSQLSCSKCGVVWLVSY